MEKNNRKIVISAIIVVALILLIVIAVNSIKDKQTNTIHEGDSGKINMEIKNILNTDVMPTIEPNTNPLNSTEITNPNT